MENIIIPSSDSIDDYLKYSKSFIFPLEGYSVDYKKDYTLKEILDIREKYPDINIYLIMNKPIFNKDLSELRNILTKIDNYNFQGILFYDVSFVKLKKDLNLKIDLVWNNTHMVTNYKTCDYYFSKGVNFGVVSNEITLDEIIELKNNTKMKIWMMIIGYPVMAFSRRKLLTNHFKHHNEEITNDLRITEHVSKTPYSVFENEFGTSFRKEEILNGSRVINAINVDGIIFKEEDISKDKFIHILDLFYKYQNKEIVYEEFISDVTSLIGNDTNFLFEKTIYQVKK